MTEIFFEILKVGDSLKNLSRASPSLPGPTEESRKRFFAFILVCFGFNIDFQITSFTEYIRTFQVK